MASRIPAWLLASFSVAVLLSHGPTAYAEPVEFLCLKSHESASLEEMAIACYSDNGCTYIEDQKGETLRDYDEASVAAALGREKIEGIVTASKPIITKITGYGYICKPLP